MEKFGFFFYVAFLTAVFHNVTFVALLEFRNSDWFRVIFFFSLSKTFHYHLSIRRKTKITKPKKKLLLPFFFQFHHFHEWMNKQWKRRKSTFLNAHKYETSDEKQTYFQSDVCDEMVTKLECRPWDPVSNFTMFNLAVWQLLALILWGKRSLSDSPLANVWRQSHRFTWSLWLQNGRRNLR